jgi:hypothetical protein
MVELSKLSPPELRAALKGGTAGWGSWGSSADHVRYSKALTGPKNKRRMCRCGCRKKRTHIGMANGVGLMGGCELWVARWVRDPRSIC